MSDTLRRFNEIADDYESFKRAIPHYGEMMERIGEVCSVWSDERSPRHVLELGCGTGELGARLIERFAPRTYRGLDGAPAMVEQARSRFEESTAETEVSLQTTSFQEWNPEGTYDWVISSLSVHHLSGQEKRALLEDIYGVMAGGGRFLLADLVEPPESLRSFYREVSRRRLLERGFTESEFEQRWQQHLEHDTPSSMERQIRWMGEIGFRERDCVWKEMNHAIIVASSP